MTVFDRPNLTPGAAKVEKELRPTELIIFGNPKVGTPLMQCSQTMGLDRLQKALIWGDEKGQVWLSYNEPEYHKKRITVKTITTSYTGRGRWSVTDGRNSKKIMRRA